MKLPYRIVEAGRQSAKRVESWMIGTTEHQRLYGVTQLFTKKNKDGSITLIIAKIVDDLLVAGREGYICIFTDTLEDEFEVGKVRVEAVLNFAGCDIIKDTDQNLILSLLQNMERLKPMELSKQRRRERDNRANDEEIRQLLSLAGTLMSLGSEVLPSASTSLGRKRNAVRDRKPEADSQVYSTGWDRKGNTDYPIRRIAGTKQKRVTYSSFGAEILACAEAEDRRYDMKTTFANIFPKIKIAHYILVDSKAIFDTIRTLHKCREFRLGKTVTIIKDPFEAGERDEITWIPGNLNMTDSLTKRSTVHSAKTNRMFRDGFWDKDMTKGVSHDSENWQ
ncbi:unnamed protein product [Agarophyton chilense]